MIGMRVKNTAFNHKAIIRDQERRTKRGLYKGAGAIRLTARRSIRKSKNPSSPGQPPHTQSESHQYYSLRNSIAYAVDNTRLSAVIGPKKTTYTRKSGRRSTRAHNVVKRIGQLHEFGGTVRQRRSWAAIRRLDIPGHRTFERMKAEQNKPVSMTYPRRPFMRPALDKIQPTLAKSWASAS